MPYRKEPIVAREVYHVFNRSVARQPIFLTKNDYQRALELINFYRFSHFPALRFSHFKRLPIKIREGILEDFTKNQKPTLEILAFCIMPNHIHFLMKPLQDNSLSLFMRDFQHGYSKYFNLKHNRNGSLFQSMFKAKRIETDEQLIHVSRYIHLNPTTSFIVKTEALESYPWSSFREYLDTYNPPDMTSPKQIINYFKSKEEYKKFVFDQADYQRELGKIKHLIFD